MEPPKNEALMEYSSSALENELKRRQHAKDKGVCDYCGRPLDSAPFCAHPPRHRKSRIETGVIPKEEPRRRG